MQRKKLNEKILCACGCGELIDKYDKKYGYQRQYKFKHCKKGRFKRGMVPWNRSVKGYMGPNRTSFRKGHVPWNKDLTKETNETLKRIAESEEIRKKKASFYVHKANCQCSFCKASRGEYKSENPSRTYYQRKARGLWSDYHDRSIPDGFDIHHRDGNCKNNNIENFQLLRHATHAKIHMEMRCGKR